MPVVELKMVTVLTNNCNTEGIVSKMVTLKSKFQIGQQYTILPQTEVIGCWHRGDHLEGTGLDG